MGNSDRKHTRVHFITQIELEADGESYTYHRTHDISMNGVFINTIKTLPVGTRGAFEIDLHFGMRHEKIKGEYEVTRVVTPDDGLSDAEHGAGIGIKFTRLDSESSILLYNVIRYNQTP